MSLSQRQSQIVPPPVPRFNCSRLVHENTLFMVEIHRCENTAPLFCLLRLVSSLLHCALDFMGHRDGTPLEDPGGPGHPAPLVPKIFFKSCSFQYFEQNFGLRAPPWGQNSAGLPVPNPGFTPGTTGCSEPRPVLRAVLSASKLGLQNQSSGFSPVADPVVKLWMGTFRSAALIPSPADPDVHFL